VDLDLGLIIVHEVTLPRHPARRLFEWSGTWPVG
jgi:hypothetical protein